MNTRKWIGCLSLVTALTGCASSARLSEQTVDRGPNPGGEVAKQCAGGAIGVLKAGLVGIPFSVGILVVCMPLAAATAVIHEVVPPWVNDGSGAPSFAYPSSGHSSRCADRQCELGSHANERSGNANFAYPTTSYFGGCPDGRCGVGSHVPEHRIWSDFYPNSYSGYYRRSQP